MTGVKDLARHKGKLGLLRLRGAGSKEALGVKWGHRKMAGVELRQQFQENPMGIKHIKLEKGPKLKFMTRTPQIQQGSMYS